PDPTPTPEPRTGYQEFEQTATGSRLDILFVVDNSDSMYYDHKKHRVANMFRGFISTLKNIDFQIGVTTTDVRYKPQSGQPLNYPGWNGTLDFIEGTQQKMITNNTENAETLLLRTIDREEAGHCILEKLTKTPCPTNWEEPIHAIRKFVEKREKENSGFIRADADLITVIVSDEDELSNGNQYATSPLKTKQYIDEQFQWQKRFNNYSVIIIPGDSSCMKEQLAQSVLGFGGAHWGSVLSHMANITMGHSVSICKNNVVDELKIIGDRARNGVMFGEVILEHTPVPNSVEVEFYPQTQIGWRVEERKVIFDQKPPIGTKIKIKYVYF
ncbi:MAG: hypothetical protein KDD34_07205, partial [Bdellovibrionales bacterium]|nr:hypothetical protein [Bdellovibrionales bacterium]